MPERDITKDILRTFTYGLFVAASTSPEGPRAATVSWVTQASFEPRLVSVGMRKGTAIHDAVAASRRFSLHVVGADQSDFARAFFKVHQSGPDEIAGYHYGLSETGVPVFDAAVAWLECEVIEEANTTGDHTIFIGRVIGSGLRASGMPALALHDTPWHYAG
jgi:flavin reductase (DIM6/NTAB) family NADH-FMN oxidoreductase RutF